MLVLTLKNTEALTINDNIKIIIQRRPGKGRSQFRVVIDAPKTTKIGRVKHIEHHDEEGTENGKDD